MRRGFHVYQVGLLTGRRQRIKAPHVVAVAQPRGVATSPRKDGG